MSDFDITWESITCPICEAGDSDNWLTVKDRFETLDEQEFSIVRCNECGFRYLNPRPEPESLEPFYSNEAYDPFVSTKSTFSVSDGVYAFVRRFSLWRKRLLIEDVQREGLLLDVGCGTGEFLSYMQNFQWKVTGVEPNADARAYAASRGLRVLPELQRIQRSRFQVITLWHVLEHLPDLRSAVQHLIHLLAPSGYLVLAMPNVDASDAREYGEHWVALDTPRHLYHFTQTDVEELFRAFPIELISARGLWLDTIYNVLYSEQLHRAQTGERYRPWTMLRTLIRSYSNDARSERTEASASVYIFQKEQTHA